MSVFQFEEPDHSPCPHCGKNVAFELKVCSECQQELLPRFRASELLFLFTGGRVIDARRGGLVLGRHAPEDDIPMLMAVVPGVLQLGGLMHGGEFIVNRNAAFVHEKRLIEINSYKQSEYVPLTNIPLTLNTRIFNTNASGDEESNLMLLIQREQFVINRGATIKYYSELEEINNSVAADLG